MARKLLFLIFILGIGLIVCAFIAQSKAPDNIRNLNIAVSCVVYLLYFADIFFPLVRREERSGKAFAGIGIRWFITLLYSGMVIAAIFVMNSLLAERPEFKVQLLVEGSLFFVLLTGLTASFFSVKRAGEIYEKEGEFRSKLDAIKDEINQLINCFERLDHVPPNIRRNLYRLRDNMRYISPVDNPEAAKIEKFYFEKVKSIRSVVAMHHPEWSVVESLITDCGQLCRQRKQLYSL